MNELKREAHVSARAAAVTLPATESGYRRDIDGLRTLAIVPVVLFHAGVFGFASGFVGVDIFFVISGYLIGGLILRGVSEGSFNFVGFYARRMRRILPALLLVIGSTLVVSWWLLNANEYKGLAATSLSALLATSNISFWKHQNYFDADSRVFPMLMTWSLGVEEQFYIIFPFVILAITRWFSKHLLSVIGLLTLASFAFSFWCTTAFPTAAFFLLPSRAWELGAGTLLAALEFKPIAIPSITARFKSLATEVAGWSGLALILMSVACFNATSPFPGALALMPVAGAGLVIWSRDSFVNRRLLSLAPVVFIGRVSYSWYLWHWPVMSLIHIVSVDDPPGWLLVAGGAVAFGLAVLSWRFVEQPFRERILPAKSVVLRYAVVLVVAVGLTGLIRIGHGAPVRLNAATTAAEAVVASGRGDCLATLAADQPDRSSNCVTPVGTQTTKVALIGDSHAAALSFGLRQTAVREHMGVSLLTKSSCPPLLGAAVVKPNMPAFAGACARFMETAFASAAADPSVKVVLLAGYWDCYKGTIANADYKAALARSVGRLKAAGKRVVVIDDVAWWRLDPVHMQFAATMPVRGALARLLWHEATPFPADGASNLYAPADADIARIVHSVAAEEGVEIFDPSKNLCTAGTCRFRSDAGLLYIDNQHLSQTGSQSALEGLLLRP